MNRVIKFRAWDGERMLYSDNRGNNTPGWWGIIVLGLEETSETVMQFTGLLDKNGKEIYEGDVVGFYMVLGEHYTEEGQSMGVEWDGAKMLIEWDAEKARFKTPFSDTENLPVQLDPKSFEVIGNIWEHPQLVEHGIQQEPKG